jgi:hypothetical protein
MSIFVSCKQDDCDDPVPSLSYDSFVVVGDSATLIHNFIDCDGDIGLSNSDTVTPFNFGGDYYYNLKIDLLVWENNEWVVVDLEGEGFNNRIPPIQEETQEETLEGKIKYNMPLLWLRVGGDSIRFRSVLIDRALNESNPTISKTIILPS